LVLRSDKKWNTIATNMPRRSVIFLKFFHCFSHECVYGCREAYGLDGQKNEKDAKQDGASPEKDGATTKDDSKE